MEVAVTKPRRAWLAALLSLVTGPLGQVYAGRLGRGILLYFANTSIFLIFIYSAARLPLGRLGLILLSLCVFAFAIFLPIDAFVLARKNRDVPLKRYQRWWVYVLLLVVEITANSFTLGSAISRIGESFKTPTRAMSPTIEGGERFFVDKMWPGDGLPQRGDVAVYSSDGPGSPLFVFRIVGLPNEIIEIRNERVLIEGVEWDDENTIIDTRIAAYPEMMNYGPVTIPPNSVFMMGDNRRLSYDSRFTGPVPISDLHARANMIYWSRERTYPDPRDSSNYTLGRIRWERIGARLD